MVTTLLNGWQLQINSKRLTLFHNNFNEAGSRVKNYRDYPDKVGGGNNMKSQWDAVGMHALQAVLAGWNNEKA